MININLDVQEINFVMQVLSQQQYGQVAGLMAKIQQQVVPQIHALQPEQPVAE